MVYEREQMLSRDEVRTAFAADVFDDLVTSLDRGGQPNDALVPGAQQARRQVAR